MNESNNLGAGIGRPSNAQPRKPIPEVATQCPGANLPGQKRHWCGKTVKQWGKGDYKYFGALCDGCSFREHEHNLERQQSQQPDAPRAGRRGMR